MPDSFDQAEAETDLRSRLRYLFYPLLHLLKSAFGTKTHTFSTHDAFFLIHHRQRVDVLLADRALGTNGYGRTLMVLRTFLLVDDNFHMALLSFPGSLQYWSLIASISTITRSSSIQ